MSVTADFSTGTLRLDLDCQPSRFESLSSRNEESYISIPKDSLVYFRQEPGRKKKFLVKSVLRDNLLGQRVKYIFIFLVSLCLLRQIRACLFLTTSTPITDKTECFPSYINYAFYYTGFFQFNFSYEGKATDISIFFLGWISIFI